MGPKRNVAAIHLGPDRAASFRVRELSNSIPHKFPGPDKRVRWEQQGKDVFAGPEMA